MMVDDASDGTIDDDDDDDDDLFETSKAIQ